MMKSLRVALATLTSAVLLCAATLPGLQHALQFEPATTKVEFVVPSTLHTVHGTFALKHGTIQFDPTTGKASGELVVDATSGDSGGNARDKRMTKEILQADKFPEIVFRPDHVEGQVAPAGKSQVQLHGMFAIHGADHEIVMPLEVEPTDAGYNVTGHFSVPYIKWGMKNPSTLILRVADTVEIKIETVAKSGVKSEPRP